MSTMQIVFSIIGLVFIGLIIGHGMWNIRRNERRKLELELELERKRQRAQSERAAGFDDDGIGEVRVIQRASERVAQQRTAAKGQASQPAPKTAAATAATPVSEAPAAAPEAPEQQSFVTEPEPQQESIRAAQDDDGLELPSMSVPEDEVKVAPEKPTKAARVKRPREEDEGPAPTQQSMDLPLEPDEEPALSQAPDMVIALHVMGDIRGPVLLQQLTELGFKYGEFDIFHRHVDTAGTGPVLFSLANMFNPGTFDIDAMEQFHTKGLALFLALPIKSNSTQAFTMMHNAAEKIAAAVEGGQVLDEHRNPLTRQAVQHIHQSIREYERKRLIRQ